MNAFKRLSIIAITLLTACAPPKPQEQITTAPEMVTPGVTSKEVTSKEEPKAKKAKTISSWELSGAIAARSKSKAWTASVNWLQQGPGHYQIRLFGPLGGGTVMIDKKDGKVIYRDGPKTVSSDNAQTLLKKQTGIGLPVHNLYYWVRGLPAPGAVQSEKRDEHNRLAFLRQGGYTIEFPSYHASDLPGQIRLAGQGIFIKMVIKKWKV